MVQPTTSIKCGYQTAKWSTTTVFFTWQKSSTQPCVCRHIADLAIAFTPDKPLKNKASCANEPCNLQGNKLVLMRRQCALQAGTREIRCLGLVNLAPTGSKALHSNLTKFPFPLSTKNSMILFIVCYTARKTSLYAWIHPILSVTASVIIVMYLQYILHKFISVYKEFHLPTKNLNNNFWIAADLHTQPVQTIGTMEITLSTLAVFLCNPNSAHSH